MPREFERYCWIMESIMWQLTGEHREKIAKGLEDKFYRFVDELGTSIEDISSEFYDGEIWLAANVIDIVKINRVRQLKEALDKLIEFYNKPQGYMNNRFTKTITAYIGSCLKMKELSLLSNENDLATAYTKRGCAYHDKQKVDEALEDYNASIVIREELNEMSKKGLIKFDENDLALAYLNRADAYIDKSATQKALDNYNACAALREELHEKSKQGLVTFDENGLAINYIYRGDVYRDKNMKEKAIVDYNQGIALLEILIKKRKQIGVSFNEHNLAKAYMERGNIYYDTAKANEAIKDYTASIEIIKDDSERSKKGLQKLDISLAKMYLYRGILYEEKLMYDCVVEDAKEAVILFTLFCKESMNYIEKLIISLDLLADTAEKIQQIENYIQVIEDGYKICMNADKNLIDDECSKMLDFVAEVFEDDETD